MTVGELKSALANKADDLEVVMSKDSEGNEFSPWAEWSYGVYTPNSTWSGEFESRQRYTKTVNALCLWPVN